MSKRHILLATVLATTLGMGTAATAFAEGKGESRGHKGHHGHKHKGMKSGKRGGKSMMRIAKKLELTDEQKASLKGFREADAEKNNALREQSKAIRTEMKALDTSSADYETAVAAIADKEANIARDRFIQRAAAKKQFDSVLTAEQKNKLDEMKAKRAAKYAERKAKKDAK